MAIRIDAAADYIIRTADLPAGDPLTLVCKIYLVADRNAYGVLLYLGNSGGTGYDSLQLATDGTMLTIKTAAGATNVGNLSVGQWYTLTYSRNGATHKCRIDAGADVTRSESNSYTPANLLMGSDSGGWLNGRMADVKIWTAELNDAEKTAEYLNTAPQRTSNLYGYWPMKAGSPERLTDYSGNARTWTANGTLTDEADPDDIGTDLGTLSESSVLDTGADAKVGSDSAALAESSELTWPGLTDGAALIEIAVIGVVVADSATLSDTTTTLSISLTATDAGTLTESSALTYAAAGNDTATLSEAAVISITLGAVDSATLSDVANVSTEGAASGIDTGTLTDIATTLTALLTASDSGMLSDTALLTYSVAVVDSAVLSESAVKADDSLLPDFDGPIRVTLGQGRRVTLG